MSNNIPDVQEDTAEGPYESYDNSSNVPLNGEESYMTCRVSSDEVNYLIFRYMQESGYVHAAFAFAHESMIGRTGIRVADKDVPPGTLISFLQKGLQYVGLEESLRQEQANSRSKKAENHQDTDFSLLASATLSALSNKLPPIKLNVPPSTAAAVIRARWETEARKKDRLPAQSSEYDDSPIQGTKPHIDQSKENGYRDITDDASREVHRPEVQIENSAAESVIRSEKAPIHKSNHDNAIIEQGNALKTNDTDTLRTQQQKQQPDIVAEPATLQQQSSQPQSELSVSTLQQQQRVSETSSEVPSSFNHKRSIANSKRTNKKQKRDNAAKKPKADGIRQGDEMDIDGVEEKLVEPATKEISSKPNAEQPKMVNGIREPSVDVGSSVESVSNHQDTKSEKRVHGTEPAPKPKDGDRNAVLPGPQPVTEQAVTKSTEDEKDALKIAEEDRLTDASPDEIMTLDMHQSEVFMCSWNPIFTDLIATGSGDASARIWQMRGLRASEGLTTVKLLPHGTDPLDRKNKDVTTLDWSSDGTLLATGSYDGIARVWARNGSLIHTLKGHTGPIFSLKWNKKGNYLLSGSYDKTTIVWNVSGSTGEIQQQFKYHDAPALDVDWRDNQIFASCSTDKTVHICQVGNPKPLKVIAGHQDEVNAVKWDPSGNLLASCSDDCTAKVWDVVSTSTEPLYDLVSHEQEIYTVKWSPTGPGSPNPSKKPMLATASFDGSVRLWNVKDGSCMSVFSRHIESVYSVAFSPSGDYLASGSLAGQLYIWSIKENRQVKSYKGKGDIFEVAWNKEETRVAAAFSSNVVAIMDVDFSNHR